MCGPFPSGEYLLVITDYHSRWVEIIILKHPTSAHIFRYLRQSLDSKNAKTGTLSYWYFSWPIQQEHCSLCHWLQSSLATVWSPDQKQTTWTVITVPVGCWPSHLCCLGHRKQASSSWVSLRQHKQNELSTTFEREPYTVVETKGNSVILEKDGRGTRHHVSFAKLCIQPVERTAQTRTDVSSPDTERSAATQTRDEGKPATKQTSANQTEASMPQRLCHLKRHFHDGAE